MSLFHMSALRLVVPGLIALGTAASAEVPKVVTDMPVVQSLAAQVMGDLGSPEVLLTQGADVHDFQLRPSQAQALTEAALLFWVGPELTPWLERAVEGLGMEGQSVPLLDAAGVELRAYGEEGGHDHADEHAAEKPDEHAGESTGEAHSEEEHAHEEAHDHEGTDPHAWLDPANARAWIDAIAAALSEADAANSAIYVANAARAKAGIDALEAEVTSILAPVGDAPIVVYHDAYGYFSGHFGVNIVGEVELGDAAAPSAEKLAGVRQLLLDGKVVCVFPEAQHDPKLLESVVDGTGVRIGAAVDPEGTTLPYGPGLHAALMKGLAQAIADCVAAGG